MAYAVALSRPLPLVGSLTCHVEPLAGSPPNQGGNAGLSVPAVSLPAVRVLTLVAVQAGETVGDGTGVGVGDAVGGPVGEGMADALGAAVGAADDGAAVDGAADVGAAVDGAADDGAATDGLEDVATARLDVGGTAGADVAGVPPDVHAPRATTAPSVSATSRVNPANVSPLPV
jgi:hypothetical protein